jgi:hypothetical protein
MDITLAQRVKATSDVLCQDVGGEVVLLDLASERYFGLDPVGTRIWNLIDRDHTLQDVLETLCAEYDAPRERLQGDLLALVAQLADAGLVTVH